MRIKLLPAEPTRASTAHVFDLLSRFAFFALCVLAPRSSTGSSAAASSCGPAGQSAPQSGHFRGSPGRLNQLLAQWLCNRVLQPGASQDWPCKIVAKSWLLRLICDEEAGCWAAMRMDMLLVQRWCNGVLQPGASQGWPCVMVCPSGPPLKYCTYDIHCNSNQTSTHKCDTAGSRSWPLHCAASLHSCRAGMDKPAPKKDSKDCRSETSTFEAFRDQLAPKKAWADLRRTTTDTNLDNYFSAWFLSPAKSCGSKYFFLSSP
jgi:hypothetical protein